MSAITLPRISAVSKLLRKAVSKGLFDHSKRVEDTGVAIAQKLGVSEKKVTLACLLHDCAKELSDKELLRIARENEIHIFEEDKQKPNELHARVGAIIAGSKYGITDPEILEGIRCHTFGEPNMRKTAKIIIIADDTEPRRKPPYASPIKITLEEHGLDYATLVALSVKSMRATAKLQPIHPLLNKSRDYYASELREFVRENPYKIIF